MKKKAIKEDQRTKKEKAYRKAKAKWQMEIQPSNNIQHNQITLNLSGLKIQSKERQDKKQITTIC